MIVDKLVAAVTESGAERRVVIRVRFGNVVEKCPEWSTVTFLRDSPKVIRESSR